MLNTACTAAGTVSAVLELSKAAWKLGVALSKLDQYAEIIDNTIGHLAGEVKSLGLECDFVYTGLEEVVRTRETGSGPRYESDERVSKYLANQAKITEITLQEVELFVKSVSREESGLMVHADSQKKLVQSRDQIKSIETKVCRHNEHLRTTLLLVNTILARLGPGRAQRRLSQELEKLPAMVKKLEQPVETNPHSQFAHTEAALVQCMRGVIMEDLKQFEIRPAAESVAGKPIFPVSYNDETHTNGASSTSAQQVVAEPGTFDALADDFDNDLDTDLAKAALDTGTTAFEAQEWGEASSLLQEALRVIQQLQKHHRAFCDIFSLNYKLAVCAYHTQDPAYAEEALKNLVKESVSSDEHLRCIYDATHLLSQLYIRVGQIDLARAECEKALQARRRLLGKQSDASLASMALMAHIYVLLDNRARAKSCLALIPEARRDTIIKTVAESLGTALEHLEFSSLLSCSIPKRSNPAATSIQDRCSSSTLGEAMQDCFPSPGTTVIGSPAINLPHSHQGILPNRTAVEEVQSARTKSPLSVGEVSEWRATENEKKSEDHSADSVALDVAAVSQSELPEVDESTKGGILSRKAILEKVGCQPRDRIEAAVCDGDHSTLASQLDKRKDSWRSKLRKRVRSERVTALHFAALFGEIDMARRLLASGYSINEIPYGYTTSLTPLTFAIGARQVEMVESLIANGAKPSEPDSWSTLAGQLMSRSWLIKTMSEAEKDFVPSRIVAIFGILLQRGWDVNVPVEKSGRTVLHQAVTFWTGSYKWDLNLRASVTSFLCERGADPFQPDTEGKTPYDMASASGHQDLLLVLHRNSGRKELGDGPVEPVELSG